MLWLTYTSYMCIWEQRIVISNHTKPHQEAVWYYHESALEGFFVRYVHFCMLLWCLCLVCCAGRDAIHSSEYQVILKELQVIDTKLLHEGDELVQSRVIKVLEQLGVRNLFPADIIRHHIVSAFNTSSYIVSLWHSILAAVSQCLRSYTYMWSACDMCTDGLVERICVPIPYILM